jgi:hypothetical protein
VEGDVLRVSERLRKRNCFGFAASRCGIYGTPVKLATSEFLSDCGFGIGLPVTE